MDLQIVMDLPALKLWTDFLTADECDALVEQARPRLTQSRTQDGNSQILSDWRDSENMSFKPGENALIDGIERRIADLFQWPLENFEALQVARYGPAQHYKQHHDYFYENAQASLANGGQRIATLLIYLNTCPSGGATQFPAVGLKVVAQKGSALYFEYRQPVPQSKTLHAGLPVEQGEKWIMTRWFRERPWKP